MGEANFYYFTCLKEYITTQFVLSEVFFVERIDLIIESRCGL